MTERGRQEPIETIRGCTLPSGELGTESRPRSLNVGFMTDFDCSTSNTGRPLAVAETGIYDPNPKSRFTFYGTSSCKCDNISHL